MERAAQIRSNLAEVHERIAAAAGRVGRNPDDITLVAVSKTHPPDLLRAALDAGVTDFGENRVQEAAEKIPVLGTTPGLRWHLIGHLQRNKARKTAELFDLVHSVDSLRLAQALDRHVAELGRPSRLPILLQVNIAGEVQKEGFDLANPDDAGLRSAFEADVAQIIALPYLEVRGLMTIAPFVDDAEQVRPVFRALRQLRVDLAHRFPTASWHDLSMGMTGDFEVAVEEGATLVRVGRAIFGERT